MLQLITRERVSEFLFMEIVGVPCLQSQEPNLEVDKIISQIRVHQHCVRTEQRFRFSGGGANAKSCACESTKVGFGEERETWRWLQHARVQQRMVLQILKESVLLPFVE